MPSFIRAAVLTIYAVGLSSLVGVSLNIHPAVASPLPRASIPAVYAGNIRAMRQARKFDETAALSSTAPGTVALRSTGLDVLGLTRYYDSLGANALSLQKLASGSSSVESDDTDFQQDCVTQLISYKTNLLGIQTLLGDPGLDKGLANYDKNSEVETLLKETVNTNKNVLSYTTVLTYNLPMLGSTLGPIVYDIKCLVDDVLDLTENITDGLLNNLGLNL